MRGKRLLALLLCMVTAFQLVPCAFAEEQAQNAADTPDFSVYAPGEIDIIMDGDGGIAVSLEAPTIYNGVETKAVAVTDIQVAAGDGWTLIPFSEPLAEDAGQVIGVRINGADIDPAGLLDLSGQPWVIAAGGKLPLDFNIRLPSNLPPEDVSEVLTITYAFDWAEEDAAERYTISFQTDNYYALDNTMPLTSTKDHRVPMEQMPEVSPNVSHFFDQVWVNADTGEIVDAGTVLTSDITVKPQISCLFEVEGETVKGFSAYAETVDVSNITIPTNIMGQTVNKIGNAAFAGCASSFTTDTMQNATGRESTANNIKNVVLEQGFTEIGIGSFGNMGNLTTISLPEGITAIGQDAFRNTFALESVELPSTAGSLGWGAFRYSAVSDAKLNDGLLSIGDDCFYGCNNLASISIPTSVTSIGKSAFYGASKLTTVNVPNSVKSLGAEAFSGCSSLEDAYIGRGVVYFKGTFQNCGSLKTVVIDGRAETITGSSDTPTFYGCDSLTDIYIRRAEDVISGKYWGCRSKPTIHWVGAW